MRRLAKLSLLTVLACFVVLLLGWAISAANARYKAAKERSADLEIRVQELRNSVRDGVRPSWRVHEGRFSISTTDRFPGKKYHDLRLWYGTNTLQKLKVDMWKFNPHIITAWVSDWTPRSEMAKFEQFSVQYSPGSVGCEVLAMLRPGESVAMEFTITFIGE